MAEPMTPEQIESAIKRISEVCPHGDKWFNCGEDECDEKQWEACDTLDGRA